MELNKYSDELFQSQPWHNIEIDSSLQSYSGLYSIQVLNGYRDHLLYSERMIQAASGIRMLSSSLRAFTSVPNAVGLGAFIIAMMLETAGKSLGIQTMGTTEMLQRVFAQEKANEVRDLMEEYLKRMQINLGRPQLQLAETRQIEMDLSAQLTRLKNSLMDGHMNSGLFKQWVNGAAFHTQMLIHQARLEGAVGSRAMRAAGIYQQQINLLLKEYKSYLSRVIFVEAWSNICCLHYKENHIFVPRFKCINWPETRRCFLESEVAETMFKKRKITWAKTYFSNLAAQIPTLVSQNDTFYIQL